MPERRHVVRSPLADADLLEIWLSIAGDSPRSADRQLDRIEDRIVQLADFPHIAVARPDIDPDMRVLTVAPYLVLFRLVSGEIQIVRVVHGARDIAMIDLP